MVLFNVGFCPKIWQNLKPNLANFTCYVLRFFFLIETLGVLPGRQRVRLL